VSWYGMLARRKLFVAFLIGLPCIWLTTEKAIAQKVGDFINLFNTMMRAALITQTRNEWSKLSVNGKR
jgi:hypothetical protein